MLHKLPKLKFLDSRSVKEDERKEAERVGAFMNVVSLSPDSSEEVRKQLIISLCHPSKTGKFLKYLIQM